MLCHLDYCNVCKDYLRYALVLCTLLSDIDGYHIFMSQVPNGERVEQPCTWRGLGHLSENGGGPLNKFGEDFHRNGFVWDAYVCGIDSDGDGVTNGEELGDPDCVWKPGISPARITKISHPGICEPIDAENCRENNHLFTNMCFNNTFKCDAIEEPGIKRLDLRIRPTEVPAEETTLFCASFVLPSEQDYHIIATDVYNANPEILHHITVRKCEPRNHSAKPDDGLIEQGICPLPSDTSCKEIVMNWSLGLPGFCIGKDKPYGIRMGKGGLHTVVLEIHWNNLELRENVMDSSGITVYYTEKLRQYDAGLLKTGTIALSLPPERVEVKDGGMCSGRCLQEHGLSQPVKIVASMTHMHYLGRRISEDIYRNGAVYRHTVDVEHFSHDAPNLIYHEEAIDLLPGDEVQTTCVYDTSARETWTFYGDGSADEMCDIYHWYYPALPKLSACETYGWKDNSCYQAHPIQDSSMNETVAQMQHVGALIHHVDTLCPSDGSTCQPECVHAIGEFKAGLKNGINENTDTDYLLYVLLYVNKGKYESVVSIIKSCNEMSSLSEIVKLNSLIDNESVVDERVMPDSDTGQEE